MEIIIGYPMLFKKLWFEALEKKCYRQPRSCLQTCLWSTIMSLPDLFPCGGGIPSSHLASSDLSRRWHLAIFGQLVQFGTPQTFKSLIRRQQLESDTLVIALIHYWYFVTGDQVTKRLGPTSVQDSYIGLPNNQMYTFKISDRKNSYILHL